MIDRDTQSSNVFSYDLFIIADQLDSSMGMSKALYYFLEKVETTVYLVVLRGELPEHIPEGPKYNLLHCGPGVFGRIRAAYIIRGLVRGQDVSTPILAVGVWAFITAILGVFYSKRRIVLWEHSLSTWRLFRDIKLFFATILLVLFKRKIKEIVCVSESNFQVTNRIMMGSVPIRIIPNFIVFHRKEHFSIRGVMNSKLIGVGSLTSVKNWKLAIKSVYKLPTDFTLDIYGRGPEELLLGKLIQRLDLTNRVRLMGHCESVDSTMKNYGVLVHPSKSETFGYVLIEAASARLPVVALNKTVMKDLIPEFVPGSLAKKNNENLFANKILEVSKSQQNFEPADERRISKFSDETIIRKWKNVLWEDKISD